MYDIYDIEVAAGRLWESPAAEARRRENSLGAVRMYEERDLSVARQMYEQQRELNRQLSRHVMELALDRLAYQHAFDSAERRRRKMLLLCA